MIFLPRVGVSSGKDQEKKFRRIRLLKKILRYMPRRASLSRYPILRRFAGSAKRRSYLWSFRISEVIPAFYLGWILTFTPIPTVCQVAAALAAAIFFRANAMVLMGLQLLSNTFTFLFLWAITYKTGAAVVSIFNSDSAKILHGMMDVGSFSWTFGNCGRVAMRWLATMLIGALTLGSALGFASSAIYRFFSRRVHKNPKIRDQRPSRPAPSPSAMKPGKD